MNFKAYFYLGRFHSPFGTFLLMLPCLWGIALNLNLATATKYIPSHSFWYYYLIFIIGSFFMRAWGCVINDIADKKFDSQVLRTKNRPLANGSLTIKQSLIFLVILSVVPFIILLSLSDFAKIIALCSIPLVMIYPLTKRFFKAPQLILGLTFNWGIILSSAIIFDEINLNSILLYIASILWCIAYDTVYAYQDVEYDKALKLNSTAILIGDKKLKMLLLSLYLDMALITIFLVGLNINVNIGYYIIQLLAYAYILYKVYKLNYKDPAQCLIFFKDNVKYAFIMLLSFIMMQI